MTQKSLDLDEGAISPDTEMGGVVKEHLATLARLADEVGLLGLQSLQDASLLLMECLNEQGGESAEPALLGLIGAWPAFVATYRSEGAEAVPGIIQFLRRPELNLPMAEEEMEILETMLLEEAGQIQPDPAAAEGSPAGEAWPRCLARIGELAEQAGNDGYQGLQDASLLLLEALTERAEEPALLALLEPWPALVEAYRAHVPSATAGLLQCLRQPGLGLALTDEDFDQLEAMLGEEAGLAGPAAEPPVPAEAAELADEPPLAGPEDRRARLQLLPVKARELLDLLLMQVDMIGARLQGVAIDDPQWLADELQEVQEHVERFSNAAHTVGYDGLARLGEFVDANLQAFVQDIASFNILRLRLLQTWLARAQRYLLSFNGAEESQKLLDLMANPHWALPFDPGLAGQILGQLQAVNPSEWGKEEPTREQSAKAADVSLALPGDVNQELLDILLQELPIQAQQLAESVQKLQAGGGLEDLQIAQRIAHTLKGSANTVGIKGVAVLTHHLEDILLACAKEQKLPGPALVGALIDATDCLEGMSDALLGQGEVPEDAQAVLQAVLDWANRIDREGLAEAEQATPESVATAQPHEEEAPAEPAQAPAAAAPTASLRVPAELVDNLFRLSGESIILNSQAQERLRRMKVQLQAMQTQFELLRQLGSELDALIDLKDLSGRALNRPGQDFDALEMDQYNELHTASRRMVEAAVDAREFSLDARKEMDFLDEVLEYQQSLVIDSQSVVMQTRLAPLASIAPRLQRSLRQTCRLTGKQAEMSLTGGQLMIDGDTLNALVDPLMHLLRNAIDHGIESEDERTALGKPAQGKVAFAFESDGNNILVRCRDDGRGLDLGAIRAAAEKRGWLQPGEAVSQEELERLILRPNFSSRTESTQTSGRGVGMDVVRSQVVAMGGAMNLRSVAGKGMTVELRVPLPLSRSHGLLVQVGHYRTVISTKGISQIFYSGAGEMTESAGEKALVLENVPYPMAKLGDLLHIHEHRHEQRPHGAVLLVRNEEKTTAVLVDHITDSRDVVIKPLGPYLAKIPGIMGATILGDGAVTPVIDIPALLQAPLRAGQAAAYELDEVVEAASLPTVLVVDDSLSNRRALEQLLADAGFKVRTAYDGVEAAELFTLAKPDIVLTDLEMPRMNGLELAAHIRAHPVGKTLPIIMITSRTTQRHRKLAEEAGIDFYLTKPVREDDLLDKINSLLAPASGQEAYG